MMALRSSGSNLEGATICVTLLDTSCMTVRVDDDGHDWSTMA